MDSAGKDSGLSFQSVSLSPPIFSYSNMWVGWLGRVYMWFEKMGWTAGWLMPILAQVIQAAILSSHPSLLSLIPSAGWWGGGLCRASNPPCLPFLLGQGRVWFVSKVSLTHNISGVFGTSVISNHPVYTHCYLITMSHISIYSGSSLISLLLDSAGKDSGLSFQSVQSVPSNLFYYIILYFTLSYYYIIILLYDMIWYDIILYYILIDWLIDWLMDC